MIPMMPVRCGTWHAVNYLNSQRCHPGKEGEGINSANTLLRRYAWRNISYARPILIELETPSFSCRQVENAWDSRLNDACLYIKHLKMLINVFYALNE